jgi:hypothetical protein
MSANKNILLLIAQTKYTKHLISTFTFHCHCIHLHSQWHTQEFFFGGGVGGLHQEFFLGRGSTNSVEDRGQREWGSGGGSPLVRGSTQFSNE